MSDDNADAGRNDLFVFGLPLYTVATLKAFNAKQLPAGAMMIDVGDGRRTALLFTRRDLARQFLDNMGVADGVVLSLDTNRAIRAIADHAGSKGGKLCIDL